jgi:hypothetical protein
VRVQDSVATTNRANESEGRRKGLRSMHEGYSTFSDTHHEELLARLEKVKRQQNKTSKIENQTRKALLSSPQEENGLSTHCLGT